MEYSDKDMVVRTEFVTVGTVNGSHFNKKLFGRGLYGRINDYEDRSISHDTKVFEIVDDKFILMPFTLMPLTACQAVRIVVQPRPRPNDGDESDYIRKFRFSGDYPFVSRHDYDIEARVPMRHPNTVANYIDLRKIEYDMSFSTSNFWGYGSSRHRVRHCDYLFLPHHQRQTLLKSGTNVLFTDNSFSITDQPLVPVKKWSKPYSTMDIVANDYNEILCAPTNMKGIDVINNILDIHTIMTDSNFSSYIKIEGSLYMLLGGSTTHNIIIDINSKKITKIEKEPLYIEHESTSKEYEKYLKKNKNKPISDKEPFNVIGYSEGERFELNVSKINGTFCSTEKIYPDLPSRFNINQYYTTIGRTIDNATNYLEAVYPKNKWDVKPTHAGTMERFGIIDQLYQLCHRDTSDVDNRGLAFNKIAFMREIYWGNEPRVIDFVSDNVINLETGITMSKEDALQHLGLDNYDILDYEELRKNIRLNGVVDLNKYPDVGYHTILPTPSYHTSIYNNVVHTSNKVSYLMTDITYPILVNNNHYYKANVELKMKDLDNMYNLDIRIHDDILNFMFYGKSTISDSLGSRVYIFENSFPSLYYKPIVSMFNLLNPVNIKGLALVPYSSQKMCFYYPKINKYTMSYATIDINDVVFKNGDDDKMTTMLYTNGKFGLTYTHFYMSPFSHKYYTMFSMIGGNFIYDKHSNDDKWVYYNYRHKYDGKIDPRYGYNGLYGKSMDLYSDPYRNYLFFSPFNSSYMPYVEDPSKYAIKASCSNASVGEVQYSLSIGY